MNIKGLKKMIDLQQELIRQFTKLNLEDKSKYQ